MFSRTTTDILRHPAQGTDISVVVRENKLFIFYQKAQIIYILSKVKLLRHKAHICRSPRKQIIYILSKVKLLRHPAQGTDISVVVRENKLFIFYQKLNY